MDTYKDGDIEDEREAALFDDDEPDDTGKYLTPDPADVYPDWGDPWDGWWSPGYPTEMDEMNANEANDYIHEFDGLDEE